MGLIFLCCLRSLAAPGQFQTDVRTAAEALWEHNPHLTTLREGEPGVESLDMHYPLVHQSNQRPYHFLHGYAQYLEERLGLRVPVTRFAGDIHLSADEKSAVPLDGLALPERFWIIVAGGKHDFTAKWWNPECYQRVVDHFSGDGAEESQAGNLRQRRDQAHHHQPFDQREVSIVRQALPHRNGLPHGPRSRDIRTTIRTPPIHRASESWPAIVAAGPFP